MRPFIPLGLRVLAALLLVSGAEGMGLAFPLDNQVFPQFATRIVHQVHRDKQAFAQASGLMSVAVTTERAITAELRLAGAAPGAHPVRRRSVRP